MSYFQQLTSECKKRAHTPQTPRKISNKSAYTPQAPRKSLNKSIETVFCAPCNTVFEAMGFFYHY